MTEWENKEGVGCCFKNTTDNPKAPAYKMDIMLGGVLYELAGWVKEGKKGKYISFNGKPKGEKKDYVAKPKPAEDDDSGIPF